MFTDQGSPTADCGLRIAVLSQRTRRRTGFTLLEIVLAVAILATMSVAIYRFVESNLTAIRVSSAAIAADAQYDGLRDLLTAQWQSLPSGKGALLGDPYKIEDQSRDEIKWICGPGPGLLTRYASGDFIVTLRLLRPSEKSDNLDLVFERKPKNDSSIADDDDETRIPLIQNVRSLDIRYFDPRVNTWVAKWSDAVTLPRLVKITIGRTDSPVPWQVIVPLGRTPL